MAVPGRLQRLRIALFGPGPAGKPEPLAPLPVAEPWEPGDMAECIVATVWGNSHGLAEGGPQRGSVFIVRTVREVTDAPDGANGTFLGFSPWPDIRFCADSFRKLAPRADEITAADRAFVDRLKARTLPSPPPRPLAARLKRILP